MTDVHVVTGAAGDIALATIRNLPPGIILACDRDAARLQQQVASLQLDGFDIHAQACDITSAEECVDLIDRASTLGRPASLINLAGLAPPRDPDQIYAVNLAGTINLLDAIETSGAQDFAAVCVASLAGHRSRAAQFDALLAAPPDGLRGRVEAAAPDADPSRLAYAVSKRGVLVQVRRRAPSWGRRGNRILSLSPGIVADSTMGTARKAVAKSGARSVLDREASVGDMASAIALALAPGASFMTGIDLLVDGGALAMVDYQLPVEERAAWHAILA